MQWEEEDEEAYLTHLNHLSISTWPLVDNDDNETRIFVWRRKRQAVGKLKQYCYSKLFTILTQNLPYSMLQWLWVELIFLSPNSL